MIRCKYLNYLSDDGCLFFGKTGVLETEWSKHALPSFSVEMQGAFGLYFHQMRLELYREKSLAVLLRFVSVARYLASLGIALHRAFRSIQYFVLQLRAEKLKLVDTV